MLIPVKVKVRKKKLSKDPRVEKARVEVQQSFLAYQKSYSEQAQQNLQNKKDALEGAYCAVQEDKLNELVKQVEDADTKNRPGESWRLINEISGRKTTKQGMIKGNSKEVRIKNWYKHFCNLLGKDQPQSNISEEEDLEKVFHELNIEDGDFTIEELKKVKQHMREGKQTGPDNIPSEVLKRCDLDEIILEFANRLLKEDVKPKQWSEVDILPLPKAGDLSDPRNYRGISLSSIVAKVVNKMILNRIQSQMDNKLRPNQNGFRPGKSATAHILALRGVIEGARSHSRKTIMKMEHL